MLGQINNQEMPITLDTGADVNTVPEELVEECQYTSQSVMVRSTSSHRAARRTATVNFDVGGYNFTTIAATCPGEELGGAAILAIVISKQRDFELLVELSATVKERVAKRNVEKGSIAPIFPNENAKVLCVDTKDTISIVSQWKTQCCKG